ncbi:MAG: hypothetical protein OXF51_09960 [Alphaproteobacteria bacterium]|nr:hypothetical protein [Alphaproteobacteria bacterium]
MHAEPCQHIVGQPRQDDFKLDRDRVAVSIQIATLVKVMLVDRRWARQAIWPQQQVERFAHRRFPDAVPPDDDGMVGKDDLAFCHAPKMGQRQSPYSHELVPACIP